MALAFCCRFSPADFIALYLSDTIVRRVFWQVMGVALSLLGMDPDLISFGFDLFQFW